MSPKKKIPPKSASSRRRPRKPVTVILKRPPRTKTGGLFRKKPEPLVPASAPVDLPPVSNRRRLEERLEMALVQPKVSVVIVNHNGVDALWHCLFALKTQSRPPEEIILVDNASQDASVSFVRANYPQVKILECQENFGPALGGNLGVKTASGDLVALVKSDVVFTPDWLARLVKEFQEAWPHTGVWASNPEARKEGGGNRPDYSTLNILGLRVPGFFGDPSTVFYPGDSCFLFARFLAPEGPFDPEFFEGQEGEYLGWRFRFMRKGIRRSAAKVFRTEGPADIPGWRNIYHQTRGRWMNLFCFYGGWNLAKVMPWLAAEALWRLVKSLGTGLDPVLGNGLALAWILTHPLAIRRKRREVQQKRKAHDGEILRYLSGRVARDGGATARVLNFASLAYCALVGLEVMEYQENA